MARLPSINARPLPPRKKTSSSASAATTSSSSSSSPSSANVPAVTKAAKRAAKRAALLRSSSSSGSGDVASSTTQGAHSQRPTAPAVSFGQAPRLSKSALRRRKRKARDAAVLGASGMRALEGVLDEEVGQDEEGGSEGTESDERQMDLGDRSAPEASSAGVKKTTAESNTNAKVGSKLRKHVLAQESLRQPHILRDLYAVRGQSQQQQTQPTPAPLNNPFAAIRMHAQNTMGLQAPPRPSTAARGNNVDADMQ